jgi:DNA-binding winged helix-turn-helix (wHTH) protein
MGELPSVTNGSPHRGLTHASVRFGSFEVDLRAAELRKSGVKIKLQGQPFQVLALLLERPGEVVTREELQEKLWAGETFVDFEHGLNKAISRLREALSDEADNPRFIETLPRRGYRLIAPVEGLTRVIGDRSSGGAAMAKPQPGPRRSRYVTVGIALVLLLLAVRVALFYSRKSSAPVTFPSEYVQITNFSDSAVAPSLSPDGRMVTFKRGENALPSSGQIYVKLLPNGESLRLTNDAHTKSAPVFTPDGTRIAYTVISDMWSTWIVPVFGGPPTRFLPNASGLTWTTDKRILFAEIKSARHMGIVTATESRTDRREIYFPANERAMAHFAYASPLVTSVGTRRTLRPERRGGRSSGAGRPVAIVKRIAFGGLSLRDDQQCAAGSVGGGTTIFRATRRKWLSRRSGWRLSTGVSRLA